MTPPEDQKREQRKPKREAAELPQMPRAIKYAWGVGMTLLVGLSLVLDRGSAWMPVINQAIDVLQLQRPPSESK